MKGKGKTSESSPPSLVPVKALATRDTTKKATIKTVTAMQAIQKSARNGGTEWVKTGGFSESDRGRLKLWWQWTLLLATQEEIVDLVSQDESKSSRAASKILKIIVHALRHHYEASKAPLPKFALDSACKKLSTLSSGWLESRIKDISKTKTVSNYVAHLQDKWPKTDAQRWRVSHESAKSAAVTTKKRKGIALAARTVGKAMKGVGSSIIDAMSQTKTIKKERDRGM